MGLLIDDSTFERANGLLDAGADIADVAKLFVPAELKLYGDAFWRAAVIEAGSFDMDYLSRKNIAQLQGLFTFEIRRTRRYF